MPTEEETKKMVILFDDEGDDKVDGTQIGTVARALGLKPTDAQVHKCAGKEYKKGERVDAAVVWTCVQGLTKEKDVGSLNDYIEALSVFDKEENGKVHISELKHGFIAVALTNETEDCSLNDYIEVISVFDKEENGKVHISEMKHCLFTVGERLTKDEANKICDGHADPEGMIKYADFVKLIMAGPGAPKE